MLLATLNKFSEIYSIHCWEKQVTGTSQIDTKNIPFSWYSQEFPLCFYISPFVKVFQEKDFKTPILCISIILSLISIGTGDKWAYLLFFIRLLLFLVSGTIT